MNCELTINATRGLYAELKNSDFKYMMTSHLNQDCIENYFNQICCSLGGITVIPWLMNFTHPSKLHV